MAATKSSKVSSHISKTNNEEDVKLGLLHKAQEHVNLEGKSYHTTNLNSI